ncbi:hypothetical protein N9U92_01245 [Prochlorococcus sp. AH-736-L15]|nr:hypothetical protein [Prochlorococcus sp. AH-736-L15]MDA9741259.1 hypothetical protein [Prochlorococcus sp. AH-736-L15]
MNYFLKANKNLLTYSLIILLVIPIFGINFFISFLGNILLLLFLIPLLLVILVFIGFNFYKSKINTCDSCGAISLGLSENCMNCGANLENISNKNQFDKKPSESTIEVKAEEVK